MHLAIVLVWALQRAIARSMSREEFVVHRSQPSQSKLDRRERCSERCSLKFQQSNPGPLWATRGVTCTTHTTCTLVVGPSSIYACLGDTQSLNMLIPTHVEYRPGLANVKSLVYEWPEEGSYKRPRDPACPLSIEDHFLLTLLLPTLPEHGTI